MVQTSFTEKKSRFMRMLSGSILGITIGAFMGFVADQLLTNYVLLHSDNSVLIIGANAVGAFVVWPLFAIIFGYLGYRFAKKRASNS